MTILVFGRSGQVARELDRHGEVRSLSREEADLSDPESCAAIIADSDARAVINAAAYTAVDRAEQDEAMAHAVNAVAPEAMARAAAARGIPFVHLSTDYVFPGTGDAAWLPNDATAPRNAYGRTKLAGEEAVRAAGGTHAILRTSWVFSAHGANFVKTILRLSAERDELAIVGDQIGGPTPAAAIADACLEIAARLAESPERTGTYHFAGAPDVSWADFAREIVDRAGRDTAVRAIATEDYPTPAERPRNSRLDCTLLEAALGIVRPDWKAGLDEVLRELADT